jgi:hypothetical protein
MKIKKDEKQVSLGIKLENLQYADFIAEEMGITRTAFINILIYEHMKNNIYNNFKHVSDPED